MTTSVARVSAGLVLGAVLVAGCSGGADDDSTGDSGAEPGRAATGSAGPADGAVGSTACPLDRERLSFVVRDWGRVFGSIGRRDHSKYTRALARELSEVEGAAADCDGSAELADFLADVRRVDARSRRPTPSYALYDAAGQSGNAWLTKVGYGNNALSVG